MLNAPEQSREMGRGACTLLLTFAFLAPAVSMRSELWGCNLC